MKPLLTIPVVIITLLALFAWMLILIIPLALLKIYTGKDFSRTWMVKWAERILEKCGVSIYPHVNRKKLGI